MLGIHLAMRTTLSKDVALLSRISRTYTRKKPLLVYGEAREVPCSTSISTNKARLLKQIIHNSKLKLIEKIALINSCVLSSNCINLMIMIKNINYF